MRSSLARSCKVVTYWVPGLARPLKSLDRRKYSSPKFQGTALQNERLGKNFQGQKIHEIITEICCPGRDRRSDFTKSKRHRRAVFRLEYCKGRHLH